jgi:hypothetical protein
MTKWDRMLVSIAIDAAKNCIHVFEKEYPTDDRPRKALQAAEKWLNDPTEENRRSVVAVELRVWRSKDWKPGRANWAADACGCAARAARHPMSSATDAIRCERYANGIKPGEYSRKWLWLVLYQNVRPDERPREPQIQQPALMTPKISNSSSG